MKKAIYPGSFDPITNGHVDIIERALKLFEHLVIAISVNQEKAPIFSLEQRKALLEQTFHDDSRVSVVIFQGLLVDFARSINTPLVVRGLRAASDFEYEFQLASMNQNLDRSLETIFLMTGSDTYFLSSRLVKEVAMLGGDVSNMVPSHVAHALKKIRDAGK